MNTTTLTHWASAAPTWERAAVGVAALLVVAMAYRVVRAAIRKLGSCDLADVITVLIALATTVYAGAGNWQFLGKAMHYGTDLRVVLVCALEGAVVVEGLRSRKNIATIGKAGADGVGLWVLAGLSSLLASSASGSLQEALGRLVIPLVAAWLWERLLAPQRLARKALREPSPIRWRITPERILVWLRLADATDMDVSTVDAGRRVARFLRKTDREKNGWRNPFTAKASADRERLRMFRDALMRYGDPTKVYGTLATIGYDQALQRMGLAAQVGANLAPLTEAERSVNLADLSTPEVPVLTSAPQEAPINTPVLTTIKTLATADGTDRPDSATAEQIIRFGWESGLGVRETARHADRDAGQVSRKFARLDEEFGARPRLDDTQAPLITQANGSATR
jgi:hypothetical protein